MVYYRIKLFGEKEDDWKELPSEFECPRNVNFAVYDFKINDDIYEYWSEEFVDAFNEDNVFRILSNNILPT